MARELQQDRQRNGADMPLPTSPDEQAPTRATVRAAGEGRSAGREDHPIEPLARPEDGRRIAAHEGCTMNPFFPLEATPGVDPAPNVPTADEIRRAEDLLHRIEVRLLHLDEGDADEVSATPPDRPAQR